jgi:3-oxoacyl-[acyl-carrier protein] reductase
MLSLAGKTALVSGGSRGIGRAVSLLFGRLGARVAVGYGHNEEAARETLQTIEADGGKAVILGADLGAPGAAERLVQDAEGALGPLDVLVVNHAIWKAAPIGEMTIEQWDETLRVNLTSTRALCAETLRSMRPRGAGAIVLVASTAGQRGEAGHSHYAASKGAMIAFGKSLAKEVGPEGIRVNIVAPGWVVTDMTRDVLATEEGASVVADIPLGRAGHPEEIAGPIAFLASDLASYVQGNVLSVNGGSVMVG